ncbi:hypothetical protein CEC48_22875 [Pseudomonas sp. K2I15]|nr:hypothetical protein CEC48_22875 [Pseudomonas sp. K2I15]
MAASRHGAAGKSDAGLPALGQGWPIAATRGIGPSFRHAEPRRGTEWWGKDPLVTFGWAGIPGVCQK